MPTLISGYTLQNKTELTDYLKSLSEEFKQSLFLHISTDTIQSQEFRETVKTIENEVKPAWQEQRIDQYGRIFLVSHQARYSSRESEEVINTVSIPAVSYYPDRSIDLLKNKINQFIDSSIQQAYSKTHNAQQTDLTDFIDRQIKSFETSLNLLCSKTTIYHSGASSGASHQVLPVDDFNQRLDIFLANFCDNIATNIEEFVQSPNPIDQASKLELETKLQGSQQEIESLREALRESNSKSQQEIESLREVLMESKDQIEKLKKVNEQLTKSQEISQNTLESTSENERLDQPKSPINDNFFSALSSISNWLPATNTNSSELSTILSSDALEEGKVTESDIKALITDKTNKILHEINESRESILTKLESLSDRLSKPSNTDQVNENPTAPSQKSDQKTEVPVVSDHVTQSQAGNQESSNGLGDHEDGRGDLFCPIPSKDSAFDRYLNDKSREVSASPRPVVLTDQAMQSHDPGIDQSIIGYNQKFGNIFVTAKDQNNTYFVVFLDIDDQGIKIHKLGFAGMEARDKMYSILKEICKERENKNVSFKGLNKIITEEKLIEDGQNFEEVKGNDRQAMLKSFLKKYQKLDQAKIVLPGTKTSRRETNEKPSGRGGSIATRVDQSSRSQSADQMTRGSASSLI